MMIVAYDAIPRLIIRIYTNYNYIYGESNG